MLGTCEGSESVLTVRKRVGYLRRFRVGFDCHIACRGPEEVCRVGFDYCKPCRGPEDVQRESGVDCCKRCRRPVDGQRVGFDCPNICRRPVYVWRVDFDYQKWRRRLCTFRESVLSAEKHVAGV